MSRLLLNSKYRARFVEPWAIISIHRYWVSIFDSYQIGLEMFYISMVNCHLLLQQWIQSLPWLHRTVPKSPSFHNLSPFTRDFLTVVPDVLVSCLRSEFPCLFQSIGRIMCPFVKLSKDSNFFDCIFIIEIIAQMNNWCNIIESEFKVSLFEGWIS